MLPLRTFIQETLRRSRTSYSTLQVALYYLIVVKPHVPRYDFTMEQPKGLSCRAMQCGRRMFLAALILASKYLQDRNYSSRAWSKISGLNTNEINQNELAFLQAVDWKLHIPEHVYQRWTDIVLKFTHTSGTSSCGDVASWRTIIPTLTPELDTIDLKPCRSFGTSGLHSAPANRIPSPCLTPHRSSPPVFPCDQTPTHPQNPPPPTLEPSLRPDYPHVQLPALPKLGLLPTPQMTPHPNNIGTPAASLAGFCTSRPSMSSAMSQAQSMCIQRSCVDPRPPCKYSKTAPSEMPSTVCPRRSSLARSSSTSSTSSPESTVSDVPSLASSQSSQSSRSSSTSSVTSGPIATAQHPLAKQATRRCANLQNNYLKEGKKGLTIATPIYEGNFQNLCASPEPLSASSTTVPDFTNFSLGTPVDVVASTHEAAQGLCALSGALPRSEPQTQYLPQPQPQHTGSRAGRKRGRTSEDLGLQKNVRQLIAMDTQGTKKEDDSTVVSDNHVADSFLMPQPKAAQSPSTQRSVSSAVKLPLPLSFPRNAGSTDRACCGNEATKFLWGAGNAPDEVADILD